MTDFTETAKSLFTFGVYGGWKDTATLDTIEQITKGDVEEYLKLLKSANKQDISANTLKQFDTIIDAGEAVIAARKALKDFREGANTVIGDEGGLSKIQMVLRDLKERYTEKKWQIEFGTAVPERQLAMLEEKLKKTREELALLPETLERSTDEKDIEKLKNRYKLLEEEAGLQDRINSILNQRQSIQDSFDRSIGQARSKWRETAQNAISVNSIEAIRLQSRMFLPNQATTQEQAIKETNQSVSMIVKLLERLGITGKSQKEYLAKIADGLTGTATLGG